MNLRSEQIAPAVVWDEASLQMRPALADILPIAIYACDAAGRILWYNDRATTLWGRTPRIGDDSELYCGSYKVYFDGRLIPRSETPMARALSTGLPIHGAEGIVERPDGSKVWAAVYIDPVKAPDGRLIGAINCFNETTALRNKDEELTRELAATRRLQEVGTQLLTERGADGLYEHIVESAVAVVGCDCASLQMLTRERDPAGELQHLAHVGFTPAAAALWQSVSAADGTPCFHALRSQQRIIVPDVATSSLGACKSAFLEHGIQAVQSTPLVSRSGALLGMLSTHWHRPYAPSHNNLLHLDLLARLAADAIERTAAEEALTRLAKGSEQQKRISEAILTNTPDLAYVFDLDHRFVYANEGLLKMWGRPREDAIGKNCLELGYEPWHAAMHDREIDQVVATKQPIRGEVPFAGSFGERIYDYIFVPVIGPDGQVEAVAGTTRDVTETREGIKELSRLKDSLSAQLADMRGLHDFSRRVMQEEDPHKVLIHALTEALALLGTNKGTVQLANPGGGLTLVSAAGFDETFSKRFAIVEADDCTTCAAALRSRKQVLVDDLSNAPEFSRFAQLSASYGVGAAHSIPLLGRNGEVIAMLTAYFAAPNVLSERDLQMMDLYLELAARHVERNQAESSLRESESRFRAFVTTSSDVMFRMSHDWSEIRQLYGKDFIAAKLEPSRNWLDRYVYPEDQIVVVNAVREALADGAAFELEHRVVRADGSPGWVHSRAIPVRDATGRITEWFGAATDVTARKRHEEHQKLLLNELNHRVKNTLATVQSMATQTLRNTNDAAVARRQIDGRLIALSKAHDVLTRENWEGASLRKVVTEAVAPYAGEQGKRFEIDGPDIRLSPKYALALAMALHELCTNAVKYGALSNETGRVSIAWNLSGANELTMGWTESMGPPVAAPLKKGFGSRLIEHGLKQDLAGDVNIAYAPEGVSCSIRAFIGSADNEDVVSAPAAGVHVGA